ncbi:L-seryl-tRNA(Sec) selenium transferase [Bosea sp. TWI1241]|uniref:L-seryl-tRNA(Sec) selenium transferase n=1 Tax=Bosea sp. TWI1241 TaxID=3148904 RepID=UPI003208F6C5
MHAPQADIRPRLPSVDRVLQSETGRVALAAHGQAAVTAAIRAALAGWRERVAQGGAAPEAEAVARQAQAALARADAPSQRRVFNLTGTVLHTNLGRAVMPEEAVQAVVTAMRHPTTLEFALDGGARGERDDHVRGLVRELTGAEDACLVNNNAAAVLLVLATHAAGREAIVSRGELIEIGGAFRLPEIMKRAGTRLHEVGTTNRTHLRDFEEAISEETGVILKAHASNYAIQGFTAEVDPTKLATLAQAKGLPFIDDLGSGTLVDLGRWGLKRERTVQDALKAGGDLVTFSGDKLLGGPQCGFIVGRKELVRACARNHLKRTLRLDKIRLAALEATLKLYRDPDRLAERLPTLRAFSRTQDDIRAQAARLLPAWREALPEGFTAELRDCASQIGSGAMPVDTLPSAALAAVPAGRHKGEALERLSAALRALPVPVIGRIKDDAVLLDLRCLTEEDDFRAQLPALTGGAA